MFTYLHVIIKETTSDGVLTLSEVKLNFIRNKGGYQKWN